MRNKHKESLSFIAIGGALLLSGLIYYLTVRTTLPILLEPLNLKPLALAGDFKAGAFLRSLPSLIHVVTFGLLTCAFIRPSVLCTFVTTSAWAGVNVLWELSCRNHQLWLRLGSELIGIDRVPACTYDDADIAASIIGIAAATCTAFFVLKLTPPQLQKSNQDGH